MPHPLLAVPGGRIPVETLLRRIDERRRDRSPVNALPCLTGGDCWRSGPRSEQALRAAAGDQPAGASARAAPVTQSDASTPRFSDAFDDAAMVFVNGSLAERAGPSLASRRGLRASTVQPLRAVRADGVSGSGRAATHSGDDCELLDRPASDQPRPDSGIVGAAGVRQQLRLSTALPAPRCPAAATSVYDAGGPLIVSDDRFGYRLRPPRTLLCSSARAVRPRLPVSAVSTVFICAGSRGLHRALRSRRSRPAPTDFDFFQQLRPRCLQDNGAGPMLGIRLVAGLGGPLTEVAGGGRSRQRASTGARRRSPPPPPDTTPPDTPITSGPPASGPDQTPTFGFGSTEPGSRFECSLDGGPFVPCSSPFTTGRLAVGRHTLAVRAIDAAGNVDPSPSVYVFVIEADSVADLPPPQQGVDVNVQEVSGQVFVGIPAGAASAARAGDEAQASQKGINFVPLSEARQIPVGSFLDTSKGTVRLQSARNLAGLRQTGDFTGSIFQVKQSRKRRTKGLTDLVLKGASFRSCATRRARQGRHGDRRRQPPHDPAAARQRPRQVPHPRPLQLGDRARHRLGGPRPLRRHPHQGQARPRRRARLPPQAQHPAQRRQELSRQSAGIRGRTSCRPGLDHHMGVQGRTVERATPWSRRGS